MRLVEITPTRRRRLRKKRAAARRTLWLARCGYISLTPATRRYHLTILQQHHSADHAHTRRVLSKMASESGQSWKCLQCKRMAKAHAVFCANCGQHWTLVAESATPNYAGQRRTSKSPRRSRRQKWQDSWEQWEEQWPLPGRSQATSPRRKGKGKGKAGKMEQRTETTPGAPLPPAEEEVWNPPLPLTVSLPSAASMSSTPTSEAVQLRQLINSLKKNKDELPPEVQALVQKAHAEDSKSQTRQMHAAVANLGKSKKALHDLVLARNQLHQSWNTFLEGAIVRWQKFAADFQAQDKELTKQIEEAKVSLQTSKESFKQVQSTTDMPEMPEVISDDETVAQPHKLHEHMDKMEALKEMKTNVEKEIAQQAPKCVSHGGRHGYWRWTAAFYGGRQVSGITIPCQSPLVLRWAHSIVTAPDFVTSWEAADSAFFLAFDHGNVPLYASGSSHTSSRCAKRSKVRFDNDICVCFYNDTITSQHFVPHESLQDTSKPWRLFPAQPDGQSAIPLSDSPDLTPVQQNDFRQPFQAFLTDLAPLFEAGATTELVEEGPVAYIATWFLNHGIPGTQGIGPRPVRLTNDPLEWGESILDAWSDILPLLPGQPDCDIVVVQPTPVNGVATNYAAHVIVSVFRSPEQAGLLLTTTTEGGVAHVVWPIIPHHTTVQDVELWSGCETPLTIRCAWGTVTGQQPLPIIHGEGCVALCHPTETESDDPSLIQMQLLGQRSEPPHPHVLDRCCGVVGSPIFATEAFGDDVSLMQRPAPSQAPSLQQAHLIGLHLPIAPVVIDHEQPLLENIAEYWPYFPKPSRDVIALHPVQDPPSFTHLDALPMLIAQRERDRFEQEHTDDVLALISVSTHAPHTAHHRRQRLKVLWIPARGTRSNFVDFFRMTVHCRQATTLCFLYHNNLLWPETDQALRSMVWRSSTSTSAFRRHRMGRLYVYTESAACSRKIFQSSSEHEREEPQDKPEDEEPEEEEPEEESVAPSPRSISRSRSRERSRGSTDSHSLLQLGRRYSGCSDSPCR